MVHICESSANIIPKGALLLILLSVFLQGCAKRPVLYPNDHLTNVGRQQAEMDIRQCMEIAEENGVDPNQNEKIAKSTAMGAGGGAVGGAVGGAISGNFGGGVATGAATGAAAGLFYGLFQAAEPSPAYKTFVNKCLIDKGYEPVGWQ